MYMIALCDDETAELNKTEQMINDFERSIREPMWSGSCAVWAAKVK